MRVWRLASSRYPPLTGEGARLAGGRWNSPGTPMVYASTHLSLSVLEMLVHLDVARLPADLVSFEVALPDEAVETLDLSLLRPGWENNPFQRETREIGDRWIREGRGLALVVPSAVVPAERNVLINPLHADIRQIRIASQEPFAFDMRLLR